MSKNDTNQKVTLLVDLVRDVNSLKENIARVEKAHEHLQSEFTTSISAIQQSLSSFGQQIETLQNSHNQLAELIKTKFGANFEVFDSRLNSLLNSQETRLNGVIKEGENSLWQLFTKKSETNEQKHNQTLTNEKEKHEKEMKEFKESMKKVVVKSVSDLSEQAAQAKSALKNISVLEATLAKAQKISANNEKLFATLQSHLKSETNKNTEESQKISNNYTDAIDEITNLNQTLRSENEKVSNECKKLSQQVDNVSKQSEEMLLKMKAEHLEWLRQERTKLTEEINDLISKKFDIMKNSQPLVTEKSVPNLPVVSFNEKPNSVKDWLTGFWKEKLWPVFQQAGYDTLISVCDLEEEDLSAMNINKEDWNLILVESGELKKVM